MLCVISIRRDEAKTVPDLTANKREFHSSSSHTSQRNGSGVANTRKLNNTSKRHPTPEPSVQYFSVGMRRWESGGPRWPKTDSVSLLWCCQKAHAEYPCCHWEYRLAYIQHCWHGWTFQERPDSCCEHFSHGVFSFFSLRVKPPQHHRVIRLNLLLSLPMKPSVFYTWKTPRMHPRASSKTSSASIIKRRCTRNQNHKWDLFSFSIFSSVSRLVSTKRKVLSLFHCSEHLTDFLFKYQFILWCCS